MTKSNSGLQALRDTCKPMSAENVEVVRKVYERFERGDFGNTEAFDPQLESVRIGGEAVGLSGQWRSLDEMKGGVVELLRAFDRFRIEVEQLIDLDDDRVFVLARNHAVGRASGAPIEQEIAHVLTLHDGRIVRWEAYWNRDEARKAVGLEK